MGNKVIIPELKITSRVQLSQSLVDRRLYTRGIVFGTVAEVAKQYGIKVQDVGTHRIFTAPKARLQIFAEKLHFACVSFGE
jgi:hypothetical protein